MRNQAKAASLAVRIRQRLGVEPVITPGKTGEFTVMADGATVTERGGNWLTRSFGAGYPDLDGVVEKLQQRQK
jgi:hypothetical protein